MAIDLVVAKPQSLSTITASVSAGKTTTRDFRGLNPLYGSTGQIGMTNHTEFSGPSILVARVGANAGSVYLVDGTYGVTDNTLVVRLKPGHSVGYVTELLKYAKLNRMVYGSGQPLVTGTMLKHLDIPTNSLDEQARIAEVLRNADDLIATLERLIAKKQAIKQGMMQQLLTGRTRLPGFSLPWNKIRLGDLGESLIGLTYSPANVKRSGTLVLRSSNIQDGYLLFDDNVFVDSPIPSRITVRENDILICVRNGSRGLIGKSVMLDHRVVGQTFGAFMAVYRSPLNPFLRYFFQSDRFKRQIDEHLGATINQITNASLNSFVADLPNDPAEQAAIGGVLADAESEIAKLRARLGKARDIKTGMMQQLLTGRTRLPVEVS